MDPKFGPAAKLDFSGSAWGEKRQSDEQNKTETTQWSLQSESGIGSLEGHKNRRADCPGIPGSPGAGDAVEGRGARPSARVVRDAARGGRSQPGVGGAVAREDRATERGGGLA